LQRFGVFTNESRFEPNGHGPAAFNIRKLMIAMEKLYAEASLEAV